MDRNPHDQARRLLRELIIQARKESKLRQQDVADRLGKPQSFISKVESGERRVDLVELREICAAMEIGLTDLVARFEKLLGGKRSRK